MKKQVVKASLKVGLLVLVGLLAAANSAKAQSLDRKMRVNIPFDFSVGNKKLPAGDYLIKRAWQDTGDLVLQITSVDGQVNTYPMTIPVERVKVNDQSTVVFHRYGDEYFLAQIWPASANQGRGFSKSRGERAAQQKSHDSAGQAMKTESGNTVTLISSSN